MLTLLLNARWRKQFRPDKENILMSEKLDNFIHKLRFKYKLSILNENTLEESWGIRLSRLHVILFCFVVAVVYFFLVAFLLVKTPLSSFFPGYAASTGLRKQVVKDSITIDSIETAMKGQQQYLTSLQNMMTGKVSMDSLSNIDTLVHRDYARINIEASEKEKNFDNQYEADARNDMAAGSQGNDATTEEAERLGYLMHTPASGVVVRHYNPAADQYGITLSLRPRSGIYASMAGTVVAEGLSASGEYQMQIQHKGDFVSVYRCRRPFTKRVGDQVQAGEALSSFPENDKCEFTFELWQEGVSRNPENYLKF